MFGKFVIYACAAMVVLVLAGCGASLGVESGVEPTETLVLDDDFELAMTVQKGDIVGLDMRVPSKAGYRIVGASFDPALFRLEHFLEYVDDGERRAQYMFKALANGSTDVLVKMEPKDGGAMEIYKRITINVGKDDSLF